MNSRDATEILELIKINCLKVLLQIYFFLIHIKIITKVRDLSDLMSLTENKITYLFEM